MLRACSCARALSKVPLLLYCLYDGILGSKTWWPQLSGSVTRGGGQFIRIWMSRVLASNLALTGWGWAHSTQGLIFGLALLASMHGFQCRLLANWCTPLELLTVLVGTVPELISHEKNCVKECTDRWTNWVSTQQKSRRLILHPLPLQSIFCVET